MICVNRDLMAAILVVTVCCDRTEPNVVITYQTPRDKIFYWDKVWISFVQRYNRNLQSQYCSRLINVTSTEGH